MPDPFLRLRRAFAGILFLALCILPGTLASQAQPQTSEQNEALIAEARRLYKEHKLVDALPLFEKLVALYPDNAAYHESLGFCILAGAATLSDPGQRKTERLRARKMFLRAKELGDTSNFMLMMIEGIPADGAEAAFSSRADVDAAMREGEAAFARGDMQQAIACYQRSLTLDPQHYDAALFIGDAYYKLQDWSRAGEWFAAAIQIDPNRETAYRYWGDALMRDSKPSQAREKYIDALVASPYERRSWVGITQWAQVARQKLSYPLIQSPSRSTDAEGRTTITLDSAALDAKDGRQHWVMYEFSRQAWKVKTFQERFPGEKEYRHSLAEEAESLRMVAVLVDKDVKEKKITSLDPSIENLLKLHQQGLIEAYVLFARADAGIVKDFEAYRRDHRGKLREFLDRWVVPPLE
jgi:tetratricopeptide (TPR) repeat protein